VNLNETVTDGGDRAESATVEQLARVLGNVVRTLQNHFKGQFYKLAGGEELTVPQIFLLRHLMQHGSSSISELADHLKLANSTVSGIVDRLERNSYVRRSRDNIDRRIVYVQLTSQAERLRTEVPDFQQKFLMNLFAGVAEESLQEMLLSLSKLNELINRAEDRKS